jgi:PAS domain S-box-containing protein
MHSLFHWLVSRTAFIRSRMGLGQILAVLLSIAAIGVRFLIGDVLTGFPFVTFFPAVVLAAFLGGRNAGITAAILGGLLSDYYLIKPFHSFIPPWPLGWIALGFYGFTVAIIVALTSGVFAALDRQKHSEKALQDLNTVLEETVAQRTAALRSSETRLRSIFETSYQYLGLLTPAGIVLEANTLSLQGIQCELIDVLGKPFWETGWFSGTPGLSELVRAAIPAIAAGESIRQEMHAFLPEGGWRWFDFSARPLRGRDGAVVAIITEATELTDRKKTEEALRQAQKMEAVGQLTGGIAHDFNNMLSIVIGSLDMARRRLTGAENPQLRQILNNATEGAQRAATLTARLLAFSRQQPLEPKTVDANALVSGMSELLRRTIGETIEIETVLSAGLWNTFADAVQLESAIINLAVNARDAMPNGGKLTIETANAHLDESYARENGEIAAGQYVMIALTDSGTGMTPDVLEHAFEPFYTTKSIGKGTGLGLSQVFGYIKQSRGHVKIYSEQEHGTTIKIYLPRQTGDDNAADDIVDERPVTRGTIHTVVLIVEDDARVRETTADSALELGYTVLVARDVAHALELVKTEPRIDLLFTDVVMPELSGRVLAERAQAQRPDLKVLFTTGYTRNAVVHNGVLDSGLALLPKPFTLQQLAAKLSDVMSAPLVKV